MKKSASIITRAKKELAKERDSEKLDRVMTILVQIEETKEVLRSLEDQLTEFAK